MNRKDFKAEKHKRTTKDEESMARRQRVTFRASGRRVSFLVRRRRTSSRSIRR
jgi:hypothetical protein